MQSMTFFAAAGDGDDAAAVVTSSSAVMRLVCLIESVLVDCHLGKLLLAQRTSEFFV